MKICHFLKQFSISARLLGLVCVFLAASSVLAQPVNRLALVIGNDNYLSVERLRNARNDAKLMADTLREAKFDVTEVNDLDRNKFWLAIDNFKSRIKKGDDVVFFFAGHGVQIGSDPVLLPVDIVAQNDAQVLRDGVPLAQIQDHLKDARFALLVIDACRDNPFKSQGTRAVGAGVRGLAPVEVANGMAIIMSAGRGQKALDIVPELTNENGLFTFEFVRSIRVPGVDVRTALLQVREHVEDRAKRANNPQRPALTDETRGNFYFFDAPAKSASTPAPVPAPAPATAVVQSNSVRVQSAEEAEQEYWNTIRDSRDTHDFSDYAHRYPNGRFIALATRQIRLLTTAAPTPTPVAVLAIKTPTKVTAPDMIVALVKPGATPAPKVPGIDSAAKLAPAVPVVSTTSVLPKEILAGDTRFNGKFVQEPVDRTLTGNGEVRWANGDVFVGTVVKGKRQGEGKINWASGQAYSGQWEADQPNGKGTMKYPNGDQYVGELSNGKPNGAGRMEFASGDAYEGQFVNGASHGQGLQVWKNGQKYEGPWVNDQPQGLGKMVFVNGDAYEGQLVNGAPEGQGSMRYASGDLYVGSLYKGKPNGQGRYNWKSGDTYLGGWQAGQKHGNGVFNWTSGDRWEGEYQDDRQTANGKLIRKGS